ncbi:MAG TPA: WXG100 family type VII secretion target [Ktedonobacteraceae bacterium]|jgi:uncharacterized protein YukE|nr:WXG100 family type VII secretion target [Ktedonobacteraceae bacterium]
MPVEGTHIDITPAHLRDTASLFYKASQDTLLLLEDLNGTAQQLIDDMYTELHQSPGALQVLCNRWREATLSLSNALELVAKNLSVAADNFEATDRNVMP